MDGHRTLGVPNMGRTDRDAPGRQRRDRLAEATALREIVRGRAPRMTRWPATNTKHKSAPGVLGRAFRTRRLVVTRPDDHMLTNNRPSPTEPVTPAGLGVLEHGEQLRRSALALRRGWLRLLVSRAIGFRLRVDSHHEAWEQDTDCGHCQA